MKSDEVPQVMLLESAAFGADDCELGNETIPGIWS